MLYSKAWDSVIFACARACGSEEKLILFSLPAVELSRFASAQASLKACPTKLSVVPQSGTRCVAPSPARGACGSEEKPSNRHLFTALKGRSFTASSR